MAVLSILRRAVPGSAGRTNTLFADALLRREKGLPPRVPTVHFFLCFLYIFFSEVVCLGGLDGSWLCGVGGDKKLQ